MLQLLPRRRAVQSNCRGFVPSSLPGCRAMQRKTRTAAFPFRPKFSTFDAKLLLLLLLLEKFFGLPLSLVPIGPSVVFGCDLLLPSISSRQGCQQLRSALRAAALALEVWPLLLLLPRRADLGRRNRIAVLLRRRQLAVRAIRTLS